MNRLNGVFLDLETVDQADLDLSHLKHALPHWQFHNATTKGETAERIQDATIIISNKVILDRDCLTQVCAFSA